MKTDRRKALECSLGLLAGAALSPSFAQSVYPNGTIRIVIPSAVGGGNDIMMRMVAQKLSEIWGTPTIIDAKPGANGAIAATAVAKAAPDGQTLLLTNSAILTNISLLSNPGYKMSEFVPVSMMALVPIAIGVRTSLGVASLQEYITLARSNSKKLSFGTAGQGSSSHFLGELLNIAASIETLHIPYKGEAPAIQDLLGGQIDSVITSIGALSRHPGKIKTLAVCGSNRFAPYPDVTTFAEAGFPNVNMPGWAAVLAPAGTPRPIVDRLSFELGRIIKLPEVASKTLDLGFEPVGWSSDKLSPFLLEQAVMVAKLVESGRVKI